VFVGADKVTGEIAALKRINTEAEENGFPITAIREVKILKALSHENIVLLKEIVTSKGESEVSCSRLEAISRRINLFVHFHRFSTGRLAQFNPPKLFAATLFRDRCSLVCVFE
jgi:cyclin-dependent kinase 12/13